MIGTFKCIVFRLSEMQISIIDQGFFWMVQERRCTTSTYSIILVNVARNYFVFVLPDQGYILYNMWTMSHFMILHSQIPMHYENVIYMFYEASLVLFEDD